MPGLIPKAKLQQPETSLITGEYLEALWEYAVKDREDEFAVDQKDPAVILPSVYHYLAAWKMILETEVLEFGDDPGPPQDVLADLHVLQKRVGNLRIYFKLSRVQLAEANCYFSLTDVLSQLIEFVEKVIDRGIGSVENTKKCLKLLNQAISDTLVVSNMLLSTP